MTAAPETASRADLPVRYPDTGDEPFMRRRAWLLVIMNFLIPGSAQALAGNRRLGRFGLGATLISWLLVVLTIVAFAASPSMAITVATHWFTLLLVQALILGYVTLWAVLTLDTLRLTRMVALGAGARAGVAVVTVALLALFGAGGAYAFTAAGVTRDTVQEVFAGTTVAPPIDGFYSFLLIGADAGVDRAGLRTDSVTVVSVNAETGHAVMFGLPRDLQYVPFPVDSPMHAIYPAGFGADGCEVDVCQFNSIYTEVELFRPELYPDAAAMGSSPGIEAVRDAAEGALGFEIQYYVLVDMSAFAWLVDALGGVTIHVETAVPIHADETFTEVLEWIEPGVHVMDGYHALWYARSRHDTSDYDRMVRQRQLQEAIVRQFDPATILSRFQDIATAGAQFVQTDVPQSMLGPFIELAQKTRDQAIERVEMTPPNIDPNGPDYAYMAQLVSDARRLAAPPTPTPTPEP